MPRKSGRKPRTVTPLDRIRNAFNPDALRRVCELPEDEFAAVYGLTTQLVAQPEPDNFYAYRDNGSNVLAVAHLDTVGAPWERGCHFLDTEGGTVVYSRALDDRLGAYVILELLPLLGLTYDVLLTVGEEQGLSTAAYFDAPIGKDYDWIIEFDRGGTDVVMYHYEDVATAALVTATGARVGDGSFSDICYLDHLGVKALNWGVGYRDYHGPRAHAYLDDTFKMVDHYLTFHGQNVGTRLDHFPSTPSYPSGGSLSWLGHYRDAELEPDVCAEADQWAEHDDDGVPDFIPAESRKWDWLDYEDDLAAR